MTRSTNMEHVEVLRELEQDGDAGLTEREREAIRQVIASLSSPKPEGEWVLVPREPSEAMLSAAHYELADKPFSNNAERSARAYAAMLAAAPQPPAEAQRCPCGQPTCVEPWEPGCGLGNSDEQVAVDAQAVGEAEVMPGTNGGFTAAVFKSVDVPAGTKLYTSPPSAPVGVEGLVVKWKKESESLDIHPAGLAARRVCAIELEHALAQQPAADNRICSVCDGGPGNDGPCLCGERRWEQPAAVDGAMLRDAERYRALVASGKFAPSFNSGWALATGTYRATKGELDAAADALAAQQGGSDNDR